MVEQASEQSIFLQAIGLPAPADRAAYLDDVCRDDPRLRAELDALLAAHDRLGSDPPTVPTPTDDPDESAPPAASTRSADAVGTVLAGRYQLLEEIGAGGMGTVWMAQQTEPVKRLVAVKLVKAGMDSKQVIARFEAERQALALMDHPNIAKVFDAGTTEVRDQKSENRGQRSEVSKRTGGSSLTSDLCPLTSGRPFFVMELVKGVPITKFCDEHRFTPRQRLELFVPVCQAIQHAHQKGIIHRDLKPSNVLVAQYDDSPVPKVIDFGVAKAIATPLSEETLHTGFGAVIGTVEYMSPEQASFNQLDVDTRSDIYSLGVLLYELLTGTTPLEHRSVKEKGVLEALRIIREEETPSPSARLSTVEGLPAIAAQRGVEPVKLSRLVRGELDWIVMKALEKDRNRRYETATALARDIERYLSDEPVRACPPSAWYRFRKLVQRHKLAFTAAVLVTAALGALGVGSMVATALIWRAYSAESSARTAESAQLQRARQNMELSRDALDKIYLRVAEERFPRDPQREREDRELLGVALDFYERFARENQGERTAQAEVAYAYHRVGEIHFKLGRHPEAKQALGRALALREQLVADFPTAPRYRHQLAASLASLGMALRGEGERAVAADHYRRALALQTQLVADFPAEAEFREYLANTHHNLGNVLKQVGDREGAIEHHGQTLDLRIQLAVDFPNRPDYQRFTARGHHSLGRLLAERNDQAAAVKHYDEGLAILTRLLAAVPANPEYRFDLALGRALLGDHLMEQGDPAAAVRHYRQAVDLLTKLASEFPAVPLYRLERGNALSFLGAALGRSGEEGAMEYHRQALDLLAQLVAEVPAVPIYRSRLANCHFTLGTALGRGRDQAAAADHLRQAIALLTNLVAEFPAVPEYRECLAKSRHNLGFALQESGDPTAAEEYRQALDLFARLADEIPDVPGHRQELARCHTNLAHHLRQSGNRAAAVDHYRQALAVRDRLVADFPAVPRYRQALARTHHQLASLLKETDEAGATEHQRRALVLQEKLVAESPDNPEYRNELGGSQHNLALALSRGGELAEARQLLEQAIGHQRTAVKAQPKHRLYRQFLRNHHSSLANILIRLGDHAEAVRLAAELPNIIPEGWEEHYRAAQFVARCVPLAEMDDHLAPDQRQELAHSYAERATEFTRQAVERGFKNVDQLKKDPDLDSLRSRPDFQKLLTELEAKVKN